MWKVALEVRQVPLERGDVEDGGEAAQVPPVTQSRPVRIGRDTRPRAQVAARDRCAPGRPMPGDRNIELPGGPG